MVLDVYFHSLAGTGSNTFSRAIAYSTPSRKIVEITDGFPGVRVGDESVLQRYRPEPCIFKGHNLFGLLEKAAIDAKYITILRDPKERLISDYYWLRRLQEMRCGVDFSYLDDLEGFIEWVRGNEHLNFYIHHLSHLNFANAKNFELKECSRVSNSVALDLARKSLKAKFLDVAITEQFDRSLWRLSDKLSIRDLAPWSISRHSATPGRPQFVDLPRGVQNEISEKLSFDIELYNEQREIFEESCPSYKSVSKFVSYINENNRKSSLDATDYTFNVKLFGRSLKALKSGANIVCVGIGGAFDELVDSGALSTFNIVGLYDRYKFDYAKAGLVVQQLESLRFEDVDAVVITTTRFFQDVRNFVIRRAHTHRVPVLVI